MLVRQDVLPVQRLATLWPIQWRAVGSAYRHYVTVNDRPRHLRGNIQPSRTQSRWPADSCNPQSCLHSHPPAGRISPAVHTSSAQTRLYASQALRQDVLEIAILGGGITGLATAYYITKELPKAKVTVFESKPVLGGWIKSTKIDVGDGKVIFESGPRSLRPQAPNGSLALRLVQELGLIDDLLITSKSAPAAQNRFIYYPDHLVRMPGPGQGIMDVLRTIWTEPAFNGIIRALFHDAGTFPRNESLTDESIGSFISRRGNKNVANNLASALFHGIYAGDIWQLSARSILAGLWNREKKHGDLVTASWNSAVAKQSWNFCDDVELQMQLGSTEWDEELKEKILDCSVFTFKRGLGQLSEQLERHLEGNGNVTLMRETAILQVDKTKDNSMVQLSYEASAKIDTTDPTPTTSRFTHAISTVAPSVLVPLIPDRIKKPTTPSFSYLSKHLDSIPSVTVCVVNLYFRTPSLLQTLSPPGGLPQSLITSGVGLQGFGYLLPNSLPFSQNPERALGVIFDSDISPDLHTTVPADKLGTRLTVMLGGHWWDGWTSYPTDTEASEMAKSVLERHLGITEIPIAVHTSLQRNCIPQYTVGHHDRMSHAHEALHDTFAGKLRVAGSWFTGVGVNDCLRAAWDVVQGLGAKAVLPNGNPEGQKRTGLERFKWGRPLVLVRRAKEGVLEVVEVEEEGQRMGYFEGVKVEERKVAGR